MIDVSLPRFRRVRSQRQRIAAAAAGAGLVAALVALAAAAGVLRPLENLVQDTGFALRTRPASGQVHIVEMDAASIAAVGRWPWPRSHHARLIERLDAAGVRTIAFDVDFSAPSSPGQDAVLARALGRAHATVVLPVFGQNAAFGDARQLDTLPPPLLRDNALLGSVSILPDRDGLVRRAPLGTLNAGAPRASLAAHLAQRNGAAGEHFPIDFAIDPATIPRHSFAAIAAGRFDPAALRGKDVVIGATAVELGDRYTVPAHGVQSGVVVQALAAETLARGIPRSLGWGAALLLAAGAAAWIMLAQTRAGVGLRAGLAAGTFLAAWHFGSLLLPLHLALAPALLTILAAAAVRLAVLLHHAIEESRMIDAESGMPNRRAIAEGLPAAEGMHVVAAMIDDFDALHAVVEDQGIATLLGRIAERLLASGASGPIYRIDDRVLAWFTPLAPAVVEDQLAGLAAVMRSPLEVAGRRVDVRLAFGIAGAGAVAGAAHAASLALRSGDVFAYHENAGKAALEQRLSLMGELDTALGEGGLEVLYQPKLDLATDRVTSAEALVRWHHPVRGYLSPDSFIPLAEETNRISELTLFVLHRAILDLKAWCARGIVIRVAVNISARVIGSRAFVGQVERLLKLTDVPRGRLIFEITESATLRNPDEARAALLRFRELGVDISMDDYGTGQSTLSYLKNFPLSELKIDRSFVQHAHRDREDALMVRSTIELAHELGLKVVAEGIEEEACLAFLRSVGCDYAQGYHIGRPMPAAALAERIAKDQVRAA